MKINTTILHNGAINVFATVDGFLETATYYGYSMREAKRMFRERFLKPKKL